MAANHCRSNAERVLILAVRPAVDPQQHRDLRAGDVADRLGQQAVDLGAVLALEADLLGRAELQLREQRVVLMRELASACRRRPAR